MSVTCICDWCQAEIDGREALSADEYNRLGLEIDGEDRHVILESRFSGTTRLGYDHPSKEVAHYHHPGCYNAALRLLEDHGAWVRERGRGPAAAQTPGWEGDSISAGVSDETPAAQSRSQRRARGDRPEPQSFDERCAAFKQTTGKDTPLMALWEANRNPVLMLRRAGIRTLADAAEAGPFAMLSIGRVGSGTVDKIERAMHAVGLDYASDLLSPAEWGNSLQDLRFACALSRSEVAKRVTDATSEDIGAWEAGRRAPTDEQRAQLAKAVGVPADALSFRRSSSNVASGHESAKDAA